MTQLIFVPRESDIREGVDLLSWDRSNHRPDFRSPGLYDTTPARGPHPVFDLEYFLLDSTVFEHLIFPASHRFISCGSSCGPNVDALKVGVPYDDTKADLLNLPLDCAVVQKYARVVLVGVAVRVIVVTIAVMKAGDGQRQNKQKCVNGHSVPDLIEEMTREDPAAMLQSSSIDVGGPAWGAREAEGHPSTGTEQGARRKRE
jgi:hypothetical protein